MYVFLRAECPKSPSFSGHQYSEIITTHRAQLPDPQRVLERISRLVKPGGWLLLEEVAISGEVVGDHAPAVRTAFKLLLKYWESNGQIPLVGTQLESWVRQTGTFDDVNVHSVITPVGNLSSSSAAAAATAQNLIQQEGITTDPKCRSLGLTFTTSFRRGFSVQTHPGLIALGYTPDVKSQCLEEMDTAKWQMDMPMYFVWAQRST
jgi:hypothetical protein